MSAEAVLGIAAGASLAGALAGLRHVRHWARAARSVAIVTCVLLMIGVPISLFSEFRDRALPAATIGLAIIAFGGLASALSADASPAMLLVSGLLLSYATLTSRSSALQPPTLASALGLATGVLSLPALRGAAQEWRAAPGRSGAATGLWLLISAALAVTVAANLLERGAWFGATPGAAWLIGGWIVSSGSLLARRGRARAALLGAAALAIAFGAMSG